MGPLICVFQAQLHWNLHSRAELGTCKLWPPALGACVKYNLFWPQITPSVEIQRVYSIWKSYVRFGPTLPISNSTQKCCEWRPGRTLVKYMFASPIGLSGLRCRVPVLKRFAAACLRVYTCSHINPCTLCDYIHTCSHNYACALDNHIHTCSRIYPCTLCDYIHTCSRIYPGTLYDYIHTCSRNYSCTLYDHFFSVYV
jgi:hypothetical protein